MVIFNKELTREKKNDLGELALRTLGLVGKRRICYVLQRTAKSQMFWKLY